MADGTRVTINKLNNDNYETWKFKMELLLIKESLWNSANKETPIQLDDIWKNQDGQARATIRLLVDDEQLTKQKRSSKCGMRCKIIIVRVLYPIRFLY